MNNETSDSDGENPTAWHTPKLHTILRFIERDSSSGPSSDSDSDNDTY